jgi:hypothetical protein
MTRPEIATRKSAEYRGSACPFTFTLKAVIDLLNPVATLGHGNQCTVSAVTSPMILQKTERRFDF